MRPLLGELLAAATGHLDAATTDGTPLPAEGVRAAVGELARLTALMARCANTFVLDDRADAACLLDAPALAMQDARWALGHAAARVRAAAEALGDDHADARNPAGDRLAAVTGCLAAGHDLLQTHFAPGPSGSRQGISPWAPAIVSAPVNAALIIEIGRYAGRLSLWMPGLAAPPDQTLPAAARVAIGAGCRWLRVAEAATWVASHTRGTTAQPALLHAIPVNVCPPRCSPRGCPPVADLCAGVVATAERLRHLAHATASRAGTWQARLAASWQYTAQGAAVTGHCTELILRRLAEPAAPLPLSPAAAAGLEQAAQAARRAWAAWRAVAHHWDTVTTRPAAALIPSAAEISDLVLWVGRLAHTDPAWTPARHRASPVRTSTALADGDHIITDVVTALHHASDCLASIAACDRESVRAAAADCELYVPTRLLPPDDDLPYRYVPPPPTMTDALLSSYDATIHAATRAAAALGDAALALNSQPTVLAALRAVAPLNTFHRPPILAAHARQPTTRPGPGQVERELRRYGISEPALLARAADIDAAAQDLISAAAPPSRHHAPANRAAPRTPAAHQPHPARLASMDSPPYTTSDIPLPRLVPINHQIRHGGMTRRR